MAPPATDVYLITGFLGSGKTTLLNRLIHAFPPQCKLMVLMNEFGEIGIDGQLIDGPEGMELLEISRGSVFCVCVKTDFIKALAAIAREIRPHVLIIEATGTANPTDIQKDLNLSIFEGRFRFREQICLLDGENFLAMYDTFASVEKQIATSTRFVLNKTDLASATDLAAVKATVAAHHPDPIIQETTYAQISLDDWVIPPSGESSDGDQAPDASPASVEETINALLKDPFGAMAPPDPVGAAVYGWKGRDRTSWEALARQIPPGIVRAKGFLEIDGAPLLFSRVGTTHELTPWENRTVPSEMANRLVAIGPPAALAQLHALATASPDLHLVSQRDPFAVTCD